MHTMFITFPHDDDQDHVIPRRWRQVVEELIGLGIALVVLLLIVVLGTSHVWWA